MRDRSFTAIEMGLAGFGLEDLGDITQGGSWHIGVLAAPGIADMLFPGRERDILISRRSRQMTAGPGRHSLQLRSEWPPSPRQR